MYRQSWQAGSQKSQSSPEIVANMAGNTDAKEGGKLFIPFYFIILISITFFSENRMFFPSLMDFMYDHSCGKT